jgi:hypothetical protein
MKVTICAALLCAGVLTGCGNASNTLLGVQPTLQQTNLLADVQIQNQMIQALIEKAGYPKDTYLPPGSPNWEFVTRAGFVEVDLQCDRYLAALYAFNREQRAGRQVITATGATIAAIMGLTGSAGVSIALVAAAFGLGANVFDAGVNSVLFTISPAAVRAVAAKGRQAYVAGIKWKEVTSRPVMMGLVQGYLSQCTPGAIEANIENAATGAPSVASSSTDIALKAAALASPGVSVAQHPQVFITRPVSEGGSTTDFKVADPVLNALPSELAYIKTKAEAGVLQRALKVKVDGDLGVKGKSETRAALVEFQIGVFRHEADTTSKATDEIDANTFSKIGNAPPMPAILKSAFERGLLTKGGPGYTALDPVAIVFAISKLGGPDLVAATTPDEVLKHMETLRKQIVAARIKDGNKDAALADVLDSKLFDK